MEFQDFIQRYGADQTTVTEGYVGRTKHTRRMEEIITSMKQDIYDNADSKAVNLLRNVDNHPGWQELATAIEDEFGFKKVIIQIVHSATSMNAMTQPYLSRCDRASLTKMPTQLTKHGEFYKDDKSYIATFWFYNTLLYHLTPEEFVAIILHEVGHNFDLMQAQFCAEYFGWVFFIKDDVIGKAKAFIRAKLGKKVSTEPKESLFAKIRIGLSKFLPIKLLGVLSETVMRLSKFTKRGHPFAIARTVIIECGRSGVFTGLAGLIALRSTIGYASEDWSDSFASAYGYGPSLMSALAKMEMVNMGYSATNPIARALNEVMYTTSTLQTLSLLMFSTHQETQTRIRKILDDLEKVAKDKNMPEETRKLIMRDVIMAREQYKRYLNGMDDNEHKGFIKSMVRNINEKLFNGKIDFRTYIFTVNALHDPESKENEELLDDSSIEASTEESTIVIETINEVYAILDKAEGDVKWN